MTTAAGEGQQQLQREVDAAWQDLEDKEEEEEEDKEKQRQQTSSNDGRFPGRCPPKRRRRGAHPFFVDSDASDEDMDNDNDNRNDDDITLSRHRLVDILSRVSDVERALARMEREVSSIRSDLCATARRGATTMMSTMTTTTSTTNEGSHEVSDSYERDEFVVSDDDEE